MKLCNKVLIWIFSLIAKKIFYDDFSKICTFINLNKKNCDFMYDDIITTLRAAEDKRFYYHCGFDFIAILRALFFRFYKGFKSGASTIDQQLVRTITQYKEKTITRKVKEIILATAINNFFEKNDIANAYLNRAYFGWNMHGIIQAHFRLSKENALQSSNLNYILISLLKYPLPKYPSEMAIKRINNRAEYIKNKQENLIV